VDPTGSLKETYTRLMHANRLTGVPWWNVNCHQTTGFIARESRKPWVM